MSTSSKSRFGGSKVYVAGHGGMAGSAIMRRLQRENCATLIARTHSQLDLTQQDQVVRFFEEQRPDYVFLAAAKVGGILANNLQPAEFIYKNLAIQTNVISAARQANVKRLLFLGSSCIYPRECPQPIKEEYILTGPLEATNRPYAIAKIAGIEMCWAFNRQYGTNYIAAMPTNLYGPNDNYDLETSHVLPALLRKMYEAKMANAQEVQVWGTGSVRREFLHVDDMADACVFLMNLPDEAYASLSRSVSHAPMVNVGCGVDVTVRELAQLVQETVGFKGRLVFDSSRPDGTPRKLLDVSRMMNLGWNAAISLRQGLVSVYREYSPIRCNKEVAAC